MTYEVTSEKQELFDKLLDLLKVFNRICEDNDIKYFVFAGTMLGAIRHKGFIPWDDDVDVIVPRADYDKLKRISENGVFKKPYFFQSPKTDKGYHKGFCRLRNSDTTEIPYMDFEMNCNHGIFIDIFPLDKIPDNERKFKLQLNKMRVYRSMLNAYARYYSGFGAEATTMAKKLAYNCLLPFFKTGLINSAVIFERFEREASKFTDNKTTRVGTIAFSYGNKRFIFEEKWWNSEVILVEFENMKVPIPKDYDALLSHSYGNYMTPVQEPTNHGDIVFSADTSYIEYIKNHFDELKAGWYRQTKKRKQ